MLSLMNINVISALEALIRAKYEYKKFIAKDYVAPLPRVQSLPGTFVSVTYIIIIKCVYVGVFRCVGLCILIVQLSAHERT